MDEGPIEALRAMGASPATLAQARAQLGLDAPGDPARVPVLAENWHASLLFLAMGTQWRLRTLPDGALWWDGLDYAALPLPLAELRHVPHRQPLPVLMPQLRQLERAALRCLNRRP